MSHGEAFKQGFKVMLAQKGSPVCITRTNAVSTSTSSHEAPGYKIRSEERDGEYFAFPEGTDIMVGDILQVKPGRDRWVVNDVEDRVSGGVYVNLKAWVERISADGTTSRRGSPGGTVFNGPIIGGVQVGGSGNVQNVTITAVDRAISELRGQIAASDLTDIEKQEALVEVDRIGDLAKQPLDTAAGAIKRRIGTLQSILSAGKDAAQQTLPLLMQLAILLKVA